MMESNGIKIPRFDGHNFGLWKKHVIIVLKSRMLVDTIVRGATKVEQAKDVGQGGVFTEHKDIQAQALLLSAMDQSVVQKVISCNTALDIWERLHQVYENTSPASVGKIFEQYYSYKKEPSDDMATHISKVEALAIHLSEVGQSQTEVSIMSKLLHSLPEQYNGLKEAWDSVHPSLQTRNNLVARMLAHEDTTASQGPVSDVALFARQRKDRGRGDKIKNVKCFKCGKLGHFKRDCRSKDSESVKSTGIALILNGGDNRNRWIIDSGASRHTCCRRDWFKTFEECSDKLAVANEELVEATGRGTITLLCRVGNREETVTLQDVLYIPEMSFNLFSTGKASERGAVMTLGAYGCVIKVDGRTIATGVRDKTLGLCILKAKTVAGVTMIVSTRRTLQEWHDTLGHADPKAISEMMANKCLDGMEIQDPPSTSCVQCPVGKANRAPHTMLSSFKPEQVGDRVVVDLIGPIRTESLGKARYILLAKDSFSGYSHVYTLKSKDEVSSALQRYIGEFEAQSGRRIMSIMSDNGSEFLNSKTKTLLAVEHIYQVLSAAYTPEQNGMAERNNKVLIETMRTMLVTSGLPTELWGEAAATATYLRNRIARRGQTKTPFEIFCGRKPFVGHLVPFGTKVQSLINDRRLGKFDSKTEPAMVVGFTDRSNTYRVYLPKDNKVKSSCDIVFRGHAQIAGGTTTNELKPGGEIDMGLSDLEPTQTSANQKGQSRDMGVNCDKQVDNGQECQVDAGESINTIGATEQGDHLVSLETEPNASVSYPDPTLEGLNPFEGNSIPRYPRRLRMPRILLNHQTREVSLEPTTYQEAITGPNGEEWLKAVKCELDAHKANGTWQVVDRPDSGTLLSTKWVFKLKRDSLGKVERFKARLVARGFEQIEGVDFNETFAPVARIESIRILLALAASSNLAIERFDVSTAFLNGTIEEEIHVEPPPGVIVQDNKCLRLLKALYGTRQAPRVWNSHFNYTIEKIGFQSIKSDPCVYYNANKGLYLAVYVDDGLIVGPTQNSCLAIIESLNRSFKTNRVVGDTFLGIQITRTPDGIHLSQSRYVSDMLVRFEMAGCTPVSMPLADTKILFDKQEGEDVKAPYRAAIGSLLYAAMATRPDILFPTILLSRFNTSPKRAHWEAAKRVMRYLSCTKDVGLWFRGPQRAMIVEAYSDADWAGDLAKRRSTSGLLIKLNDCPIIYSSRLQDAVATSSTEAEFIAGSQAANELSWLLMFLAELGVKYETPTLFMDNKSAIQLIKNHDVKRRSKHIEIKYHHVREKFCSGLFKMLYVNTTEQLADYLTKRIGADQLEALLERSNVRSIPTQRSRCKRTDDFDRGGLLESTLSSAVL